MNIVLSDRQLCDLEMILNGGFAPLNGFLDEQDYYSVISTSRLTNGALWPIPIVLSISTTMATKCNVGTSIVLCNEENLPIAKMQVTSIYKPDIVKEFNAVFGCVDATHPYMGLFLANPDFVNIGGPVSVIQDVPHFDFVEHRLSPAQTRDYFAKHGST